MTEQLENLVDCLEEDRGLGGEFLAYMAMAELDIKNISGPFRFHWNVYIPYGGEAYSEIDLLLICSVGFVVLESKNYSGEITGDEEKDFWTIDYGNRTYYKPNPLRQNETHLWALRRYLSQFGYDSTALHSIVVYGDAAKLKCVRRRTDSPAVQCHCRELGKKLRTCLQNGTPALDEEEIALFDQAFSVLAQTTKQQREAHAERIRKKYLL
ncbi:MAG: NERD domain-containing protein [Oscillospiraceae bacterium]|jgi:hypothetical protein|nr:NERD domain-containing protein [Oscillospiraceae bacterium]